MEVEERAGAGFIEERRSIKGRAAKHMLAAAQHM